MNFLKIVAILFVFVLLTALTQVGGIVYVFSRFLFKKTDQWAKRQHHKILFRVSTFVILYGIVSFLIVPIIAKPLGRVPLPWTETNKLQPLNIWTCLLNRHYVKPALKKTALEVASQMHDKFPGTITNYLDANFPFIDKFPLLPHLSHNDGKKLDLSFCYRQALTGAPTNDCPSFIGYGVSEEPRSNENNTTAYCTSKGYWQYDILTKMVYQGNKDDFQFDEERSRELIQLIALQPTIGEIFIEPHLKTRLKLTSDKIRFHGCRAVRHDDHIHIQIK